MPQKEHILGEDFGVRFFPRSDFSLLSDVACGAMSVVDEELATIVPEVAAVAVAEGCCGWRMQESTSGMLQWRDTGDGRPEPPRTRLLDVRRAPAPLPLAPPASAEASSSRRSSERPVCATAPDADEATTSDISMSDAETPAVAAAGEMGVEPDVCCASKSYA